MQWNLGGQGLNLLEMAALDADVLLVQEVSRDEAGWCSTEGDHFHWVTYRDPLMWRGVGVGIAADKLDCIISKRSTRRGIWVLARVKGLGRVVFGSLHALTGVTNAKYQEAIIDFNRSLPSTWQQYPVLCGVDANEVPVWREEVDDMEISSPVLLVSASSNMNLFVDQFLRGDLRPVRPRLEQLKAPTHFPRDSSRSGRQIDMVWQKRLNCGPVRIDADRRHTIGTDHAALVIDLFVKQKSSLRWGNDSRARWVVKELPDGDIHDEDDLIKLAKQCSKPRASKAYFDDQEVKEAFCLAKTERTDRALWKKAQKLRKRKRAQWQQERYTSILNGDWDHYKALQRERDRRGGWWGDMLQDRSAEQLTTAVTNHLEEKLTNVAMPDWDEILQRHIDLIPGGDFFEPFTLLDVRTVLQDMKAASAVGPDGISVSLLRHVASHDNLGPQMLSLVNRIISSLELPHTWRDNFLALIAKVDRPKQPKDLRPICVSSAFHKMITKLVCTRVMPRLRTGSRISCCGKGRQAADVIGCLSRVRDVVQEWREPMYICKLDIAGAFDRIDRLQLVQFLTENLSADDFPHELRYMLAQLRSYRLVGNIPGGNRLEIEPNVGIKQGAPESAELFGMVMDHLLSTLLGTKAWKAMGTNHAELDVSLVFYQDDIFLLETDFVRLCRRVKVLERYLSRAGLRLATEKTKIIASPWVKGVRKVKVGGDVFEVAPKDESLRVLGLAFNLHENPSQQARELLCRARGAAAKHQQLLRGKAAWTRKIKMMETLVASQFRWTAGAVHWTPEDLKQANIMQLHVMRTIFRMGRLGDESWVTWNTRTMRTCRAWLAAHGFCRWSTTILTLQHTLAGHWPRRTEFIGPYHRPEPSIPMRALLWRNTQWWRRQQELSPQVGYRHKGHVHVHNPERQLSDAHGAAWHIVAQDRLQWTNVRAAFLAKWDPRWTRDRQSAILNQ